MMLENSTYSVISPEGGAAILWRDAGKARDAAAAFQPTAANCYRWGIADAVVPEPAGRGPPRPRRGGAPAGRLHHARPARPARPAAGRAAAAAARALPAHRRLPRGGRGRPGRDRGRAARRHDQRLARDAVAPRGGGSAPGGLAEGGHQLALEGRDVGHHAAPDQLAVAEGRLVHPLRAGQDEVVLDAERAGGARADDPGRDRHAAAVADDPDRQAAVVHRADQVEDGGVAAHLVGGVAAGDDEAVEAGAVELRGGDVRLHLQPVLARVGVRVGAHRHDRRPLLAQPHDGDPVLEVLDALGDEHGVGASGEAHGSTLTPPRLDRPQHRAGAHADLAVAPQRLAVGLHRRGRVAHDQRARG